MNHLTVSDALEKLKAAADPFVSVFQHGSLDLEIYKPNKIDLQSTHTRDEVYIISNGSGIFYHEGKRKQVEKGDFLFVPAGDDHRFEKFTDDFSTWVIFYGPEGGESVPK